MWRQTLQAAIKALLGASAVAQYVKPRLETPAFHTSTNSRCFISDPVSVSVKEVDDPSIWTHVALWETQKKVLTPGFDLPNIRHCGYLENGPSEVNFSLFLFSLNLASTLPFEQIVFKKQTHCQKPGAVAQQTEPLPMILQVDYSID